MKCFVTKNNQLTKIKQLTLPKVDSLIIVAHNDDEMFPAGYLQNKRDLGHNIGFVVLTDGTGSNYRGKTGKELMDLRTHESFEAIREFWGTFFLDYQYKSSYVKKQKKKLARTIAAIYQQSRPFYLLTHSPIDDHKTHLATTEAVIEAARLQRRENNHVPTSILGFEVWTPLRVLTSLVEEYTLTPKQVDDKFILQSTYSSQNEANAYPEATEGLSLYNKVLSDAHTASRTGHMELFFRLSHLVWDERFANVSATDFGGATLMLSQYEKSIKKLNETQALTALAEVFIPQYIESCKKVSVTSV